MVAHTDPWGARETDFQRRRFVSTDTRPALLDETLSRSFQADGKSTLPQDNRPRPTVVPYLQPDGNLDNEFGT